MRARQLLVERSKLELIDVELTGGRSAAQISGSQVPWTGGLATRDVCLDSDGNQLDLMAVELRCATPLQVRGPFPAGGLHQRREQSVCADSPGWSLRARPHDGWAS